MVLVLDSVVSCLPCHTLAAFGGGDSAQAGWPPGFYRGHVGFHRGWCPPSYGYAYRVRAYRLPAYSCYSYAGGPSRPYIAPRFHCFAPRPYCPPVVYCPPQLDCVSPVYYAATSLLPSCLLPTSLLPTCRPILRSVVRYSVITQSTCSTTPLQPASILDDSAFDEPFAVLSTSSDNYVTRSKAAPTRWVIKPA